MKQYMFVMSNQIEHVCIFSPITMLYETIFCSTQMYAKFKKICLTGCCHIIFPEREGIQQRDEEEVGRNESHNHFT